MVPTNEREHRNRAPTWAGLGKHPDGACGIPSKTRLAECHLSQALRRVGVLGLTGRQACLARMTQQSRQLFTDRTLQILGACRFFSVVTGFLEGADFTELQQSLGCRSPR